MERLLCVGGECAGEMVPVAADIVKRHGCPVMVRKTEHLTMKNFTTTADVTITTRPPHKYKVEHFSSGTETEMVLVPSSYEGLETFRLLVQVYKLAAKHQAKKEVY